MFKFGGFAVVFWLGLQHPQGFLSVSEIQHMTSKLLETIVSLQLVPTLS